MTIGHVQRALGVDGSGAPPGISNPSATFAVAVGSGNLVVGIATWDSSASVLNSVTDDKGNTYNVADSINDATNGQRAASFWLSGITNAPITVTANLSANNQAARVAIGEYSGVAPTSPLDGHVGQVQNAAGTGANAVTSGNITTTADGDLIYGMVIGDGGVAATRTQGTGFTLENSSPGTNVAALSTEYQVQVTHGAIAATWTQSANDSNITFVMAFKPAVAAMRGMFIRGWDNT
jgi:hypothetical protein